MLDESREWVVVRLRTGAFKLVEAVALPIGGHGTVLVPLVGEAEAEAIDRVINASTWRGAKRPGHFRSGMPCIRCDGSRQPDLLTVAVLTQAERKFVGTIRPTAQNAWEYRISPTAATEEPAREAPPDGMMNETGECASAQDAFDAILRLAAVRGWAVDANPSPTLDSAA